VDCQRRALAAGPRNGKEAEIVDGLDENAFVVTSGNRSPTHGETVTVLERVGGPS